MDEWDAYNEVRNTSSVWTDGAQLGLMGTILGLIGTNPWTSGTMKLVRAWMLWSPYALGTRTLLWFGDGCSGHCMPLEQENVAKHGTVIHALATTATITTTTTTTTTATTTTTKVTCLRL